MRILPVLDLMGGVVVRGVAGRRSEYRPVVSRLGPSSRPLHVARAFRTHFGLEELYVADLDAIAGGDPALATYSILKDDGFRLWIDAGVRDGSRVPLLSAADSLVVGLETVAGPQVVAAACRTHGERVVFSLDLNGGRPLGDTAAWGTTAPHEIAARAVAVGVRRLIALDLARVGVGDGTGTEALCARLTAAHPGVEVIAGGGVCGPADLRRLWACGVRTALVASALHDGRLTRADWE